MEHGRISIWFFIGVLLLIYGVMILGSGVLNWNTPPPGVVLANLHVDVWWGVLLVVIGAFYSYTFSPHRRGN